MFIIKYKKIFVAISAVLVSLSVASIIFFGLNFGIDFKGGSLLEVEYTNSRPEQSLVEENIKSVSIGEALIQPMGEVGYSIKTRDITELERGEVMKALGIDAVEKSFTSIGPSVGAELVRKSIISFILVVLGIIFWIAFSFRKVSKPVSSWKYGFMAIVSLIHDVTISAGVFAFLGYLTGAEVDTLFVVAILTVLGLSVSDTIVVFDRIRENIRVGHFKTFEETVGKSLNQVYTRSIATSSTVIIVLLALVFFGPASTRVFSIMLTAGMFFGTYSSIFLASPLLVILEGAQNKNKK
ncbi:MAG: protein translocase subunit SecF [Candidatus Pacebacteria bacterium]|nr:protein translocase subunit SecF [Candidatus Paceibacterota bacterium]